MIEVEQACVTRSPSDAVVDRWPDFVHHELVYRSLLLGPKNPRALAAWVGLGGAGHNSRLGPERRNVGTGIFDELKQSRSGLVRVPLEALRPRGELIPWPVQEPRKRRVPKVLHSHK